MQFHLASFVAILAAVCVSAQTLQINTPTNAIQCQPQLITWSGGTGPYFVSVLPGGQPSAAAINDFGQQSGTQLTWVVNVQQGTSVALSIRDQTGTVASSAPFTIGSSSDSSCVGQSSSNASGSSTAGVSTTSGASGSTTAASGSTTASSGSTTSGASSSKASSSASGSATSSGAASSSSSAAKPFAQIGSAGLIGAAVVALFA